MWAVGCIFAEAIIIRPLFYSKNNADLLYEMMKVIFLTKDFGKSYRVGCLGYGSKKQIHVRNHQR